VGSVLPQPHETKIWDLLILNCLWGASLDLQFGCVWKVGSRASLHSDRSIPSPASARDNGHVDCRGLLFGYCQWRSFSTDNKKSICTLTAACSSIFARAVGCPDLTGLCRSTSQMLRLCRLHRFPPDPYPLSEYSWPCLLFWTYQLQKSATEHSSPCHCISLYTIAECTGADCK
jgi:hypothetical protein